MVLYNKAAYARRWGRARVQLASSHGKYLSLTFTLLPLAVQKLANSLTMLDDPAVRVGNTEKVRASGVVSEAATSDGNVAPIHLRAARDEDPSMARKLLIKCDLRLIPILGSLYLVSFLDRSNIANARLFGLEKSLHMPSTGFNTCLWIFYLPFVVVEIPSNLFMSMNKIKPNQYLASAMLILGLVSMCQGLTRSYGGLLACRFIMGILEAALPPGASLEPAGKIKN